MAKVDELLADYGDHHRTRGNVACHFVGIPLIVFGLLAALGAVRLGTAAGVTVTAAEILIGVGVVYYLTLDVRLALGMLAVTAGLDALGRVAGWQAGVAAFVVGWVFQGIGHAVYEKRSPAFLRNFVHLMVGPIFLLNEVAHVRRVEPAA